MKDWLKMGGLTLIEMIIAIAVMAILLGAVGMILIQGLNLWQSESRSVSLEDQLRAVEDRIIRDLRLSKSAAAPVSTRLEFKFLDPTNTITNYYTLTGSTLKRSLNGGAADPIADNISAQFAVIPMTQSSTPLLKVHVELSSAIGRVTKTVTFDVTLRNR